METTAQQSRTITEFQHNIGQTATSQTVEPNGDIRLTFPTFTAIVLPRGTIFRVG
jgi:hypothetical protein